MSKINLLDFLSPGDKIYSGGEVYEVTKSTKTERTNCMTEEKIREFVLISINECMDEYTDDCETEDIEPDYCDVIYDEDFSKTILACVEEKCENEGYDIDILDWCDDNDIDFYELVSDAVLDWFD